MSENNFGSAEQLVKKTFAERQLIVVSGKEAIEAVNKAEQEEKKDKEDKSKWLDIALNTISIGNGWQASVGKIIGAASIEVYQNLRKAWDKGLPIQVVSLNSAAHLIFPPGHPRLDTVYACHPANPTTYYPLADFHRIAFEGKFAEAMTLLMALGANHFRVERVSGWSSDFAANMTTDGLIANAASVSAEASRTNQRTNSMLFEASLETKHAPQLPEKLIWYHHEATWQSIATGRLKYGLSAFKINVSYRDDYGIDSKLAASIQGAGLGIGGSFEAHQSTVWQIEGTFQDI